MLKYVFYLPNHPVEFLNTDLCRIKKQEVGKGLPLQGRKTNLKAILHDYTELTSTFYQDVEECIEK